VVEQHRGERVVEPLDADDGVMCCVVVETHVHKNKPSQSLEGWGLIDGDEFILIWSKHRAVWDEVGHGRHTHHAD
jgi:hypothetical protein